MTRFENRIEMTIAQYEALKRRIDDLYGALLAARLSNPPQKNWRKNSLPESAI
jgi:hypothetical protein